MDVAVAVLHQFDRNNRIVEATGTDELTRPIMPFHQPIREHFLAA